MVFQDNILKFSRLDEVWRLLYRTCFRNGNRDVKYLDRCLLHLLTQGFILFSTTSSVGVFWFEFRGETMSKSTFRSKLSREISIHEK